MRKEIVIKLIKGSNLSAEEIEKLIARCDDQEAIDVVEEVFASGQFKDDRAIALARKHAVRDGYVWVKALPHIPKYSQEEYFSLLLELGQDYYKNYNALRSIIVSNFKFKDLEPADAMLKGFTLATLCKSDSYVWEKLLQNESFNKEQLLVIGETADYPSIWKTIFERLDLKSFTKKELNALKIKAPAMIGSILRLKIFKPREVMKGLEDYFDSASSHLSYEDIAYLLIRVCKLTERQRLNFARKMEDKVLLWRIVEETCSHVKRSQKDLVALLRYGKSEKRKEIIKLLNPQTLDELALSLAMSEDSLSLSLLAELLASGQINKVSCMYLAQMVNWDTCWIALIDSGHFSDEEIVSFVKGITMASHQRTVWIKACEVIDLSAYSFDMLMHIGEFANDTSTWQKIEETLATRQKSVF